MNTKHMSLYETLLATGIPLDSHESDLYALVTDESRRIVRQAFRDLKIRHYRTFRSDIDGKLWFDLPFMYNPFWKSNKV